uniref:Uncharacterized protein n=1 Tax=Setaria viridis TaxID=4556 RepID=A0A4U6W192_SETVI|nr:hypothetical protein SEVIR_2G345250v2 [Setaria viridis]
MRGQGLLDRTSMLLILALWSGTISPIFQRELAASKLLKKCCRYSSLLMFNSACFPYCKVTNKTV